jgi:hypothetical protein
MLRESLEALPREKAREEAKSDAPPADAKPEAKPSAPEPVRRAVEQPEEKPIPKQEAKTSPPPPARQKEKESKQPVPPPDMGRGGAQHQAIQQRLKAVAEGLGFRATVEKPVLEGQGSIDLVLEKPGYAVACEINVTSTIDYEVGNVSKCFKAGFAKVAVICPNPERLSRLVEAMKGCFAPEQVAKIVFLSADDFIAHLQTETLAEVSGPAKAEPAQERLRGYKVTRHFVQLSPEDAKAREDSALKMLAKKMRHAQRTGHK